MALPKRVEIITLRVLLICVAASLWLGQAGAQVGQAGEARQATAVKVIGLEPQAMLRLREDPSFDAKVIAYIPSGTDQLYFGGECNDRWCKLLFRDLTGWASRKHLDLGQAQVAAKPDETSGAGAQSLALSGGDFYRISGSRAGEALQMHRTPDPRTPVVGSIPAGTRRIEHAGRCENRWCLVRFEGAEGWVPEATLTKDTEVAAGSDTVRAAAPPPPTLPSGTEARVVKRYAIAGIFADSVLQIRSEPDQGAQFLGAIPGDATDVEGLGDCRAAWCLVRHNGVVGWVARRHLAENGPAGNAPLRIVNLGLAESLPVMDAPAREASAIGEIPAYASGLVRIGECGRDWCHIRYLGLAGWVEGRYVAPEN